ncbi:MAG TPA: DUF1552 domain-containing protein [Gammaproteobacteria bacterium]|nr:DUF1552 domain-containing protein [Gammaproteobacteria bacterium]
MFLTKKALPRRAFLRGVGTSLALPLLDSMLPAFAADGASAPPRLSFIYAGNGIVHRNWTPATSGRDFELTPNLASLGKVRDELNVITGLAHLEADTKGDGTGDHPRASAAWLTGVHAYDRTRPGVEVRLATSADQIAAGVIGRDTAVASLELSIDPPMQGACDSGDCFYVNTVSWRNETTPNLAELHPRVVFERLFGDGGSSAERLARSRVTGSILDSVLDEASRLAGTLGAGDTRKLDEYLDSVREVERRIQSAEAKGTQDIALPERPTSIPDTYEEHARIMYDLQVLAFQADVTRITSMIVARELSGLSYPNIGVSNGHHNVSHHRDDPDLIDEKTRIDTYHVELFAEFVEKLQATPDGDGSLLDHSLVLYGSGMGDGNLHRHDDLPLLTVGRLGGKIRTGQHLVYPEHTPMTNLLLTLLEQVGAHIDTLGDSTGRLSPDLLSA